MQKRFLTVLLAVSVFTAMGRVSLGADLTTALEGTEVVQSVSDTDTIDGEGDTIEMTAKKLEIVGTTDEERKVTGETGTDLSVGSGSTIQIGSSTAEGKSSLVLRDNSGTGGDLLNSGEITLTGGSEAGSDAVLTVHNYTQDGTLTVEQGGNTSAKVSISGDAEIEGGSLTVDAGTNATFAVDGVYKQSGGEATFSGTNDTQKNITAGSSEISGGSLTVEGGEAAFGSTTAIKDAAEVTIEGGKVSFGNTTFTGGDNGSSITTIKNGTVKFVTSDSGSNTISNATVNVEGGEATFGNVEIKGNTGNLDVSGGTANLTSVSVKNTSAQMNISGGTATVSGNADSMGNVSITDGGTLNMTNASAKYTQNGGAFSVGVAGTTESEATFTTKTFEQTGANTTSTFGGIAPTATDKYNAKVDTTNIKEGAAEIVGGKQSLGAVTLGDTSTNGSLDITGGDSTFTSLDIKAGSELEMTDGTLKITGVTTANGTVNISDDADFTAGAYTQQAGTMTVTGTTATFTGAVSDNTGAGAIGLGEDGELVFDGETSTTSTLKTIAGAENGTITVKKGTLKVGAVNTDETVGDTNVVKDAIVNYAGNVNAVGDVDVQGTVTTGGTWTQKSDSLTVGSDENDATFTAANFVQDGEQTETTLSGTASATTNGFAVTGTSKINEGTLNIAGGQHSLGNTTIGTDGGTDVTSAKLFVTGGKAEFGDLVINDDSKANITGGTSTFKSITAKEGSTFTVSGANTQANIGIAEAGSVLKADSKVMVSDGAKLTGGFSGGTHTFTNGFEVKEQASSIDLSGNVNVSGTSSVSGGGQFKTNGTYTQIATQDTPEPSLSVAGRDGGNGTFDADTAAFSANTFIQNAGSSIFGAVDDDDDDELFGAYITTTEINAGKMTVNGAQNTFGTTTIGKAAVDSTPAGSADLVITGGDSAFGATTLYGNDTTVEITGGANIFTSLTGVEAGDDNDSEITISGDETTVAVVEASNLKGTVVNVSGDAELEFRGDTTSSEAINVRGHGSVTFTGAYTQEADTAASLNVTGKDAKAILTNTATFNGDVNLQSEGNLVFKGPQADITFAQDTNIDAADGTIQVIEGAQFTASTEIGGSGTGAKVIGGLIVDGKSTTPEKASTATFRKDTIFSGDVAVTNGGKLVVEKASGATDEPTYTQAGGTLTVSGMDWTTETPTTTASGEFDAKGAFVVTDDAQVYFNGAKVATGSMDVKKGTVEIAGGADNKFNATTIGDTANNGLIQVTGGSAEFTTVDFKSDASKLVVGDSEATAEAKITNLINATEAKGIIEVGPNGALIANKVHAANEAHKIAAMTVEGAAADKTASATFTGNVESFDDVLISAFGSFTAENDYTQKDGELKIAGGEANYSTLKIAGTSDGMVTSGTTTVSALLNAANNVTVNGGTLKVQGSQGSTAEHKQTAGEFAVNSGSYIADKYVQSGTGSSVFNGEITEGMTEATTKITATEIQKNTATVNSGWHSFGDTTIGDGSDSGTIVVENTGRAQFEDVEFNNATSKLSVSGAEARAVITGGLDTFADTNVNVTDGGWLEFTGTDGSSTIAHKINAASGGIAIVDGYTLISNPEQNIKNLTVEGQNETSQTASAATFKGGLKTTGDVIVANKGKLIVGESSQEAAYSQIGGTFTLHNGSFEAKKAATFTGTAIDLTGTSADGFAFTAPTITFMGESNLTAHSENMALGTAGTTEWNIDGKTTIYSGTKEHSYYAGNGLTFKGSKFSLGKDATLDMSYGDIEIDATNSATINGTLRFGAEKEGQAINVANMDTYGDLKFTQNNGDIRNAKIAIGTKFGQAILDAGGNTAVRLDTPITLVSGVSQSTSPKTWNVNSALAGFTITLNQDNGEYQITEISNVRKLDYDDYSGFIQGSLGGNPAAFSPGFIRNGLGVLANEVGGGTWNTMGPNHTAVQKIWSNGSAAGKKHYDLFEHINSGGGMSEGDGKVYTGAQAAHAAQANFQQALQIINGLDNHFGDLRAEYRMAGSLSGRGYAAPIYRSPRYYKTSRARGYRGVDMALSEAANRIWAGVIGQWENTKTQDAISGYKYRSFGVMIGYDRIVGPVTVGGSFAYARGTYTDKGMVSNDSHINNYSLNAYVNYYHTTGWWANALLGWNHARNDMKYSTGTGRLEEKYSNNSIYFEAKGGYDWKIGQFRISPSLGLGVIHNSSRAHDAKYQGQAFIRYGRASITSGYLPIRLEGAYRTAVGSGMLEASVNAGYTRMFKKNSPTMDMTLVGLNNSIGYQSNKIKRGANILNLGAGVKYDTGRFEGGVKYDYYHRSKSNAHRLYGYVGIKF